MKIQNGEGKVSLRLHNGRWQWWYGGDACWRNLDYEFPQVETVSDAWRLAWYMTAQALRGNVYRSVEP